MAYRCENDVCVPSDLQQAGIFKALQRSINELIKQGAVPGLTTYRVRVDGIVGWQTANMVRDVLHSVTKLSSMFWQLSGEDFSPRHVAAYAEALATTFAQHGGVAVNREGAPKWLTVLSPPAAAAWSLRPLFAKHKQVQ